jgi:hypothetical protein
VIKGSRARRARKDSRGRLAAGDRSVLAAPLASGLAGIYQGQPPYPVRPATQGCNPRANRVRQDPKCRHSLWSQWVLVSSPRPVMPPAQ